MIWKASIGCEKCANLGPCTKYKHVFDVCLHLHHCALLLLAAVFCDFVLFIVFFLISLQFLVCPSLRPPLYPFSSSSSFPPTALSFRLQLPLVFLSSGVCAQVGSPSVWLTRVVSHRAALLALLLPAFVRTPFSDSKMHTAALRRHAVSSVDTECQDVGEDHGVSHLEVPAVHIHICSGRDRTAYLTKIFTERGCASTKRASWWILVTRRTHFRDACLGSNDDEGTVKCDKHCDLRELVS